MDNAAPITELLQQLFQEQRFGALSTQADKHPYCNLVAFTPSEDLKFLVFTTPRSTNKYSNLLKNPVAAFLIDNRATAEKDVGSGVAVTALGRVSELAHEQADAFRALHIKRHEDFEDFINLSDCAVFQFHVEKYIIAQGIEQISSLVIR